VDIVELHERALDRTGQIVAGIAPEQLALPTPCNDWDVRTLLGHLVRGNQNAAAAADGTPRNPNPIADPGEDPIGEYGESAEAVKRAWREPGRLDQSYQTPLGTLPGQGLLSLRLIETVTHGWDLARATGQQPKFDDDLVLAAMESAQANLGGQRPPGVPFAPPVDVGDDRPAIDRLAGFMGRQP
jgi:uncharacterized protein (TIGR03086 family)